MTGRYLRATTDGHHCRPPGGFGLSLDIYDTPNVFTLWECECRRLWQVRANVRPPGYCVRRGWRRVGPLATRWWRWRYRYGAATIEHGQPPTAHEALPRGAAIAPPEHRKN